MESDDLWMSLAEAARHTGHSEVSLRQAVRRGRLRARREGVSNRATYYTTAGDLRAYLAGRRSWKGYRGETEHT